MGRRVGVLEEGLDDEQAVRWMRQAEMRLMSTAPPDHPTATRMHACRRAAKNLRYKLERAGTPPTAIVVEVRALIEKRGYLEMIEAFVNRPPVRPRGPELSPSAPHEQIQHDDYEDHDDEGG